MIDQLTVQGDIRKVIKTDKEAIKSLDIYTEIYYSIAVSWFKLSRERGLSITESLEVVDKEILKITNKTLKTPS